jgi:carboxymethylenebutenolidase
MTEKIELGALARPAQKKAPGLVLIHEWWGLNWEMEVQAEKYAAAGYLALAIDMFQGKVTDQPAEAQKIMDGMDPKHAHEVLKAAIAWLRGNPACNGKVGTLGFCLGGAWSLNASVANPVEATVVYHGAVNKKADELRHLKGPVLGHFATRETYIPPESATAFAEEMQKAGKPAEVHFYDAAHAFTRPKGPNFDPAASDLAWRRTMRFLQENLA